ncbi:helix-turn-helix domain-containing protein [Haloferula chungangensis]|uniref:Helix-turn-helix domain-containing protein n=1 Tax=Haloferula chungangensis TaxID=1048331 RepID=A0ABW2L895_9BACT
MKEQFSTGAHAVSDPAEFPDLVAPVWEVVHDQLDSGTYEGKFDFATDGVSVCYHEQLSRRVRVRGAMAPGLVGFAMADGICREQGRWWGRSHPVGGMPFMGPANRELDIVFPAGGHKRVVVMSADVFRESYSSLSGRDPRFLDSGAHFLNLSMTAQVRIWRRLKAMLEHANKGGSFTPNELVEIFVDACPDNNPALHLGPSRAKHLVHRVMELAEESSFTLSVADLCVLLRASKRTVEYAFRDYLGVSPYALLQRHRLNKCRRQLLAADPGTTTVHQVSNALGFRDSGRFAALYRQYFAELPSATLARAASDALRLPGFSAPRRKLG